MRRSLLLAFIAGLSGILISPGLAAPPRIKAFCIDFNWGPGGINGFAGPGVWADASPSEHVDWYAGIGCNTIQSFAVSCNGYAWYKGGAVPPQPGLKSDFLTELVQLGHQRGMKVMGYFCVGANTRWAQEHPDLSYGTPSAPHIPFTREYLRFLSQSIEEALKKTGMDGFMVDWVWCPGGQDGRTKWLPCEQEMYRELMGRPFPGKDQMTTADELSFKRKAIDRCWAAIRDAAKSVSPSCVIWLSCSNVSDATVTDSRLFREVDWLMNEATDPRAMGNVRRMKGPRTQLVQCVVGWGAGHDARKIVLDAKNRDLGIYGFAAPGPSSLPLPVATFHAKPVSSFEGNDRNIAVLARWYRGESPEEVVVQNDFGQIELRPACATPVGGSPIIADGQVGNWEDGRDSVRWRFRVRQAGKLAVTLTYACAKGNEGSRFAVEVGSARFVGKTRATGVSWRDYDRFVLGEIDLKPGDFVVTVRPMDPKHWKPMSLKAIDLVPLR